MKIYKINNTKSLKKESKYDNHEIFRTVRKPMPPPTHIMDYDIQDKPSRQIDDSQKQDVNTTRSDLMNEATVMCEIKGHKLGKWQHSRAGASNHCETCGKSVQILTFPKSNESDISGDAILSVCNI